MFFGFFFFKQKTAYEMRISDWSSDVCSSDLVSRFQRDARPKWRENYMSKNIPRNIRGIDAHRSCFRVHRQKTDRTCIASFVGGCRSVRPRADGLRPPLDGERAPDRKSVV